MSLAGLVSGGGLGDWMGWHRQTACTSAADTHQATNARVYICRRGSSVSIQDVQL